MLLIHDVAAATARLDAGTLVCPDPACGGQLGPWGRARPRRLRLGAGGSETQTPRRVRCRGYRVTHVLVSARSFPRRPDTVETVGAALLAAADGAGHRRVAEQVDRPATTSSGQARSPAVSSVSAVEGSRSREEGNLYLLDTRGALHLMRPFLFGRTCLTCRHWSTFRVDGVEGHGGHVRFVSMEHGHQLRDASAAEPLAAVGLLPP